MSRSGAEFSTKTSRPNFLFHVSSRLQLTSASSSFDKDGGLALCELSNLTDALLLYLLNIQPIGIIGTFPLIRSLLPTST